MDITIFNEDVFAYDMDLETVSSLIRELKDDDPRYWQLAKALQRSLNIYDERDLETVPAARAALAGVLAEPAASSAINHIAIGTRISTPHGCGRCARHAAKWPVPYPTCWL